ncbi:MAG: hypothetical protein WDZ70_02380 [Candidatus Paceibacterota bacterium]
MKEGALQWPKPEEMSEEEKQKDFDKNTRDTPSNFLEQMNKEDQIGFIHFVFENKESADKIESAIEALKEAVGEEKAKEVIEEAKKRMENKE